MTALNKGWSLSEWGAPPVWPHRWCTYGARLTWTVESSPAFLHFLSYPSSFSAASTKHFVLLSSQSVSFTHLFYFHWLLNISRDLQMRNTCFLSSCCLLSALLWSHWGPSQPPCCFISWPWTAAHLTWPLSSSCHCWPLAPGTILNLVFQDTILSQFSSCLWLLPLVLFVHYSVVLIYYSTCIWRKICQVFFIPNIFVCDRVISHIFRIFNLLL